MLGSSNSNEEGSLRTYSLSDSRIYKAARGTQFFLMLEKLWSEFLAYLTDNTTNQLKSQTFSPFIIFLASDERLNPLLSL